MHIVEGVSVGISAIRSNKMRSLLTMLGIIIGVASVLAMIAIGDGAKEIVMRDAQKLGGANQFTVYRTWFKRQNNRWVRVRSNEYLEYGDVLAIEAGVSICECSHTQNSGLERRINSNRGRS